jgi:hypothetical protein
MSPKRPELFCSEEFFTGGFKGVDAGGLGEDGLKGAGAGGLKGIDAGGFKTTCV